MKTAFLKTFVVVSDGDVISHIGVKPCTLFLWGGAQGSVPRVNDLFQSIVKNGRMKSKYPPKWWMMKQRQAEGPTKECLGV